MSESMLSSTVAELVLQKPARSRVFEQQGIDYCCGGQKTLESACQNAGADAAEVLAAIEASDQQPPAENDTDWTTMSLGQLADHIIATHHAFLREELPRVDELLNRVVAAHGDNHPKLHDVRRTYTALVQELLPHMMKEEQILFPLIHQLENAQEVGTALPQSHCGSVNNPIRVMEQEHQNAGNGLRQLHELTNNYTPPEGVCPTYHAMLDGLKNLEIDLHHHIHKENNFLFPKASELEAALAK